jgi:hypothetical protein
MINLKNKLQNIIKQYFPYQITINDDCILINQLIVTTNTTSIPKEYIDYLTLFISDVLISEPSNLHILYYNDSYSITDFNNLLINQIAWLVDIPETFNEQEYLDQYPETIDYYQPWAKDNGYSDGQRLYHHYIIYNQFNDSTSLNDSRKRIKDTQDPIFVRVCNGLANRLRTMNSFLTLSQETQRPLYVCWQSGPGFSDEGFCDLFEEIPEISFISEEEYIKASLQSFNIDQEITKTVNTLRYEYSRKTEHITESIFNKQICYSGDSCLEYMLPLDFEYKNSLYKLLKPVPTILEKIKQLGKNFDKNTIGVHIRRGDAIRCPWRKLTSRNDEDFFKLVDQYDSEYSIFLSTDCKKTQEEFIGRYKNKQNIYYHDHKEFSHSQDMYKNKLFQSDAVIDLFLLSQTNKIIGSKFSSFSDLAAKLGGIELTVADNDSPTNEQISDPISKVSIICGVMNRFEALRVSLESWRNYSDIISEIIIVDWSSDLDLSFLEEHDPRIRIIRIDGKKYYNVSKALNQAIKHVTGDFILKLDVDYVLNPYYDFFNLNYINDTEFLTGDSSHRILDNDLGFLGNLHGLLFARTEHIKEVGGFQEQVEGYGWEDSDMYKRLENIGLKKIFLNHSRMSVFHIPHDNNVRVKHYEDKFLMDSLLKNQQLCQSLNLKNNVSIDCFLDWQYPSITEKQAFNSHQYVQDKTLKNIYIACPWASIIDYIENYLCLSPETKDYWTDEIKTQNYLKRIISQNSKIFLKLLDRNTHTVCQHIHWKKLLGFWEHIELKNLYLSHLTTNDSHNTINFNPWHISATNTELSSNSTNMKYKDITEKTLLCSFIGAHNQWYRSNIRLDIVDHFKKLNSNRHKIFIQLNDEWFYNKIIYDHQIKKQPLSIDDVSFYNNNIVNYNEILSDSVFSLCPDGSGPNTIRLWESMSIGSIPVLFENDWLRPSIDGFAWEDFSITIKKNELNNMIDILESISEKDIRKMSINCINAYNKIRLKTCF